MVAALSLPIFLVERARGAVVSKISPLWKRINRLKVMVAMGEVFTPLDSDKDRLPLSDDEAFLDLQTQYTLLLERNKLLEERLLAEKQRCFLLQKRLVDKPPQDREESLFPLRSLTARVIYRAPSTWSTALWLNVGTFHNGAEEAPIVGLNSPVVIGNALVGIVDAVQEKQCRVRLITDPALSPSVRALRDAGSVQHMKIALEKIYEQSALLEPYFESSDEKNLFVEQLAGLVQLLNQSREISLLAKGEIQGIARWKGASGDLLLRGVGFNYDFADQEGPARDLRTGEVLDFPDSEPAVPLLKVHDVLVTTGLDGVFPPGLTVGEIVQIDPLQEGDYFYTLEARPTAGDLNTLSFVTVLPPMPTQHKQLQPPSR